MNAFGGGPSLQWTPDEGKITTKLTQRDFFSLKTPDT